MIFYLPSVKIYKYEVLFNFQKCKGNSQAAQISNGRIALTSFVDVTIMEIIICLKTGDILAKDFKFPTVDLFLLFKNSLVIAGGYLIIYLQFWF